MYVASHPVLVVGPGRLPRSRNQDRHLPIRIVGKRYLVGVQEVLPAGIRNAAQIAHRPARYRPPTCTLDPAIPDGSVTGLVAVTTGWR
jgi:hypothetical protein